MTSSTESSTVPDKGPIDNQEPLPMAAIAGVAVAGLIVVVVIIVALVICDRKRKARKRPERKLSEDSDENDYESILNATYINPNAADITSKPNSHPGHSQLPDPRRGSDQHLAKKRPGEDTESAVVIKLSQGRILEMIMNTQYFPQALNQMPAKDRYNDNDVYNRLDHAQRPQEPREPYFVYSHIGSF
nr:hypothetical protein BaRGS_010321 [Batillaria attramentaria]